jgi:hypothetical protein
MNCALPLAAASFLFLAHNGISQRVVPVGQGVTGQGINDLMEYQGKLVVAGGFQDFNGHARNNIVGWDGDQFFDMPGAFEGLYDRVYSLALHDGDLVAWGRQDGAPRIARWDGSAWSTMGSVSNANAYSGCLVVNDGQLYASASDMPVTRWNGSAWVQVGGSFNGDVMALAAYNGSLYAGGNFSANDATGLSHLARWNGTAWEPVLSGLNGSVHDLDSTSEGLAIAGSFTMDGGSTMALPKWTVYDGVQFSESTEAPPEIVTGVCTYPEGGFLLGVNGFALWKRPGGPDAFIDLSPVNAAITFGGKTYVAGGGNNATSYRPANGIGEVVSGDFQGHLDINNVKAVIAPMPTVFLDRRSIFQPGFEVPQGNGTSTINFAQPWVMGKAAGVVHSSAPGQSSGSPSHPWAGPQADVMDDAFYRRYHQMWKLDKGMIGNHIAHWADPGYQVPDVIASWPGNGNVVNGEPAKLAPFADLNTNDLYEPEQGEYPLIRGDQAIYTIQHSVADLDSLHPAMPLDLHIMYYAYADSGNADTYNTVFENVKLVNRGAQTYDDLRFAIYMDADIGNYLDDLSDCDSLLSLFYAYNGDDLDQDIEGHPGFGAQPPAQGALFLNTPMTAFISKMPAWNLPEEELMNGTIGGVPFTQTGYASHFQYPGGAFTEGTQGNMPGPRQGVGSIGPYSLVPGDTLCIDIAYPYANAASGGALASVAALKLRAQALRDWYAAQDMSCSDYPAVFAGVAELDPGSIGLYPNPAHNSITLEQAGHGEDVLVQVHAMSGRLVAQADWRASTTQVGMDVSSLPAGIYAVAVRTHAGVQVWRLVKQ